MLISKQNLSLPLAFVVLRIFFFLIASGSLAWSQPVFETSTLTWDTIGLDSNKPVTEGPNTFPVGTRVCNVGTAVATNVTATFVETSPSTSYISPQTGFPTSFTEASLPTGPSAPDRHTIANTPSNCRDFYFGVEVTRLKAAHFSSQGYNINITSDEGVMGNYSGTLYVEKLVSQNRNSKVSLIGPTVLYVGETYTYTLETSTKDYDFVESIIELPVVFETLSISTTYTTPAGAVNSSAFGEGSAYSGKVGGAPIVSVYEVKVLEAGTGNFSSVIYDLSGSSYHYNSDYSVNPVTFISTVDTWVPPSITKDFSPSLIAINETSALTLSFTNDASNPSSLSDMSLTDTYPAGLVNADTPNVTTTCGGTVTANAGEGTLSISGASLAAGASCTVTVTVTASTANDYVNTIPVNALSTIETVSNQTAASATLEVREFDYGDAPSPYGSASHTLDLAGSYFLGALVDHDIANWADGTDDNENSTDDDSEGSNDEDGVIIADLVPSASTEITLAVTGAGYLNAWIDWNIDGDFNESGEQIITDLQDDSGLDTANPNLGTITISIPVPASSTGLSYARFRWSKDPGITATGQALEGEVEDYQVLIGEAELSIIKSVDTHIILDPPDYKGITDADNSGNVTPGDTLPFTLTVTNNGPANVTSFMVTDVVPAGYSYIDTPISMTGGSFQNDTANPSLVWTITNLAVGNSASLSFKALVNESSTPSDYTNTATISSSTAPDSDLTNNSSSVTPDILRIRKYVCNESLQGDGNCDVGSGGASDPTDDFVFSVNGSPGDTLVYRIEYENFATQVDVFTFIDAIPVFTTLALDSFAASAEVQVDCHASATNTTETLDTGAINPVVADIISVCDGFIPPNEHGAVMFKAIVN